MTHRHTGAQLLYFLYIYRVFEEKGVLASKAPSDKTVINSVSFNYSEDFICNALLHQLQHFIIRKTAQTPMQPYCTAAPTATPHQLQRRINCNATSPPMPYQWQCDSLKVCVNIICS